MESSTTKQFIIEIICNIFQVLTSTATEKYSDSESTIAKIPGREQSVNKKLYYVFVSVIGCILSQKMINVISDIHFGGKKLCIIK